MMVLWWLPRKFLHLHSEDGGSDSFTVALTPLAVYGTFEQVGRPWSWMATFKVSLL